MTATPFPSTGSGCAATTTSASPTASALHACEALLVDLDGTLLDTTHGVEQSWRRAADELGLDFDAVRPFMHGIPAVQVIDQIAPWLPFAERSRIADEVLADQAGDDARIVWKPGAEDLVGQLQGLSWAVVTSGTRRLAEAGMCKAGIQLPPIMVTSDDVGIGKPHPAPFLRAAHLLRASPADCAALEDSPAGVSSARQAGMTVVAIIGTYPAGRLDDADHVLSRLPSIRVEPGSGRILLDRLPPALS